MKNQPNRNYVSNDVVQTPVKLAKALVDHFKPTGKILEPCCGDGNFLCVLPPGTESCEITQGRDFMDWTVPVNWIITNPPWSKIRPFLEKALTTADNVVFLMTINHLWTKARLRLVYENHFGIKEIVMVKTPPEFPSSGFQLGAIYLQRNWEGPTKTSFIHD